MIESTPPRPDKTFKKITLEEVKVELNINNSSYADLISAIETSSTFQISPEIYRLDTDLPRLIEKLVSENKKPLVDKKLQLVICPYVHRNLTENLFLYHCEEDKTISEESPYDDSYIDQGLGWYISGASPRGNVLNVQFNKEKLTPLDIATLKRIGIEPKIYRL